MFNFNREYVYQVTQIVCNSVHDCKGSTDLGVTNRFYQVGKFANTESMNNEDWLYR